jgi:R3H domain
MRRESGGRRGPRRPRRDREHDRDRDPASIKERIEKEFAREIEMRVSYFLQSPEEELELEPMNSYRRRMVHNLAGKYHLRSESRGEDRERYVVLVKTGETAAAAPPPSRVRLWDFGNQTFPVNPGARGVHVALKVDGSVELLREGDRSQVLADRVVTSHEFRVRQGKILVPGDPGY